MTKGEHELPWRRQVAHDDGGDSDHIELSASKRDCGGSDGYNNDNNNDRGRLADASEIGEPERLREWLARELKVRVGGGGSRCPEAAATTGRPREKKLALASSLNDLTSRPELERLVRGEQAKSWQESRNVIVDIDNGNRLQRQSGGGHETKRATSASNLSDKSREDLDQKIDDRLSFKFTKRVESGASNRVVQNPSKLAPVDAKQNETANWQQPHQQQQHHHRELGQQNQPNQRQQVAISATSSENKTVDKQETNQKAEGDQAKDRSINSGKQTSRKLPTFGAIPRKLSRLPYFSYNGKARNIEQNNQTESSSQKPIVTITPASLTGGKNNNLASKTLDIRVENEEDNLPKDSRIPTLIKRSATNLSSNQYSSGRLVIEDDDLDLKPNQRTHQGATRSAKGINWRGYSNISNLFPVDRPLRLTNGNNNSNQHSSSLFNLNQLNRSNRRPATRSALGHSETFSKRNSQGYNYQPRFRSPNQLNSEGDLLTTTTSATTMRRQNAVGKPMAATGASGGYKQQMGRALGASGSRGRPQSINGNGGAATGPGQTGYHLTKNHRSPSASSLHYSSGIGMSPYGAPILDPDCPVHGDYPPAPTGGGGGGNRNQRGGTLSKSSQNLHGQAMGGADLLYADGVTRGADYPDYYDTRLPLRNRASSLYSPQSPQSPPFGSYRSIVNQDRGFGNAGLMGSGGGGGKYGGSGNAYYNSASRFSLYHPSETGVRSHLAPTNEQLRRILGYQPPTKPVHLHPQWAYSRPFIHLQGGRSPSPQLMDRELGAGGESDLFSQLAPVRFEVYNQLQDAQAIRAVDFHPSGEVYAIGSNSRALRICAYPADHELRHFALDQHEVHSPRVLFKFLQVHRGSIYCVGFNGSGQLLATGSNDQTVHIVKYNSTTHSPDGDEFRLTMHDGTVRDLCFIDDSSSGSSLLLSAGGGDNRIYATDCDTITPFQSMAGHTQMVMSLSQVAGATFVSASYDKTIRFWDLRTRGCTSIVSAPPNYGTAGNWVGPGAPVCAVKVEPSGRLLASGHSDSTCMLYDIRGSRIIQTFRPHDDEIRTINFSPKSYYLLTGGYDGRVVLSDLQGDLTAPLPLACVAESDDKIVQAKWHPSDFTFVTTSADKSATLWALPTE